MLIFLKCQSHLRVSWNVRTYIHMCRFSFILLSTSRFLSIFILVLFEEHVSSWKILFSFKFHCPCHRGSSYRGITLEWSLGFRYLDFARSGAIMHIALRAISISIELLGGGFFSFFFLFLSRLFSRTWPRAKQNQGNRYINTTLADHEFLREHTFSFCLAQKFNISLPRTLSNWWSEW